MPTPSWEKARAKLDQIDAAENPRQLDLPSKRLKRLAGDRDDQYAIWINRQYRICFAWDDGDARYVEIVDYHDWERTMSYERQRTRRKPTHPGYVVRTELDELGLSVTEAAERLGVPRQTLSAVVNGDRSVSPRMALKLGRFFGNGTGLWLTMQTRYDQWDVEHDRQARQEADRIEPVVA